jgi:hypothetical protein
MSGNANTNEHALFCSPDGQGLGLGVASKMETVDRLSRELGWNTRRRTRPGQSAGIQKGQRAEESSIEQDRCSDCQEGN